MAKQQVSELPPRIPSNEADLNQAICLLGNLLKSRQFKAELSSKTRARLTELIGVYPTEQQAISWKKNLKELRSEVVKKQAGG